jgi:protein-tyrosine phosphatase
MFHFLKKNKNYNLEWLGVDMHSHLLPGIDDGAKNIENSVSYIKALHELGLHTFICTPHIFKELYPNNKGTILPVLEKLREEPELKKLPIRIDAAAEYMIDADFDEPFKKSDLLCLPGNQLLIEMSYIAENPQIEKYIFDLNIKGYKPILAHPERYVFYHNDIAKIRRLQEMGCLLQMNILSPSGYYGKEVKQVAMKLVKEGLIDLIGTDLHHERHLEALKIFLQTGKCMDILYNLNLKNSAFYKA